MAIENRGIEVTVWLTKAEAAKYAKVSDRLIQNAVIAGELPAYAVGEGRTYRLRAEDIDEWLMSKSYEPSKSA